MSDFEGFETRREGQTTIITISRPEALNALNRVVMSKLDLFLSWCEEQSYSDLRCVIITGQGEKSFVAGADIKEFSGLDPKQAEEFGLKGQKIFNRIGALKVPVIAAVNGFALGGGLELALACDYIYASDNAKFALPECSLGLMPGYGGTVRMARLVGTGAALEAAMTGGMISATDARIMGLVNKVLPQAGLLAAALESAKLIAQRAPESVRRIKESVRQSIDLPLDEALRAEAALFGRLFALEDKKEGVAAFIEKRKPVFVGK